MPRRSRQGTTPPVLIVEDSPDFSNLLKFLVEDEGYEGIQFPLTETDIVGWTKKNLPSVILMDLALRRKGGMEYIEELKADSETKDIPIIIISGRDLTTKEILGLQVRDIKYLRKGRVEVQEIKDEIRRSIFSGSAEKPSEE
ncbi:MAG: response regulator [Bacteroidota bacterium]